MNQPDIRLLATDLDGTFLNSDHESIPPRNIEALKAWQDSGRHVVFATGRPPRWMNVLHNSGIQDGTAICSNGALVHDLATNKTTTRRGLDGDALSQIVEAVRSSVPSAGFACEFGFSIVSDRQFFMPGYDGSSPIVEDILRHEVDEPVAKLLVHDDSGDPHALYTTLSSAIDISLAQCTISGDRYVEISAAGITKADALVEHAAELGLEASQVVAFGDNHNDIAMLEWSGHSVAMANALDPVKRIASEVTLSNDDGGVAVVIERLLSTLPSPS